VTKWLKRAGFCYKKPSGIDGKAYKEAKRQFIEAHRSLKESLGDDEKIFFLDSRHPEHQKRHSLRLALEGKTSDSCENRLSKKSAFDRSDRA
jgi:hypothetical protein